MAPSVGHLTIHLLHSYIKRAIITVNNILMQNPCSTTINNIKLQWEKLCCQYVAWKRSDLDLGTNGSLCYDKKLAASYYAQKYCVLFCDIIDANRI